MHQRLAEYGGTIDAVFVCLCLPRYDCECFGPRPSMLHEIAERLRVPLANVPCVGGTPEFVEMALAAGVRSMAVRTGKGTAAAGNGAGRDAIEIHDDLAAVADALLAGGLTGRPAPCIVSGLRRTTAEPPAATLLAGASPAAPPLASIQTLDAPLPNHRP